MNRTARLDGSNGTDRAAPSTVWLPKGLSTSDLMGMRSTGMTNAAISRAANIKLAAVNEMIGKTPAEIRAKAAAEAGRKGGTRKAKNAQEKHVVTKERRYGKLKASIVAIRLEGEICHYRLSPSEKRVDIVLPGSETACMTLAFEQVETLAEELISVMTAIDDKTA